MEADFTRQDSRFDGRKIAAAASGCSRELMRLPASCAVCVEMGLCRSADNSATCLTAGVLRVKRRRLQAYDRSIDRQLRSPMQTYALRLISRPTLFNFSTCFGDFFTTSRDPCGSSMSAIPLRWSFLSATGRIATAFPKNIS